MLEKHPKLPAPTAISPGWYVLAELLIPVAIQLNSGCMRGLSLAGMSDAVIAQSSPNKKL